MLILRSILATFEAVAQPASSECLRGGSAEKDCIGSGHHRDMVHLYSTTHSDRNMAIS